MESVINPNALAEVKHYLKGIKQKDIDKIPKELLEYIDSNSSSDYQCNFDYNAPLKDLDLLEETRGVIGMICYDYWCDTDELKKRFQTRLNENELKYQEKLRNENNPNDLFKNSTMHLRETREEKEISTLTKVENNLFKRLINKIKSIFQKEK